MRSCATLLFCLSKEAQNTQTKHWLQKKNPVLLELGDTGVKIIFTIYHWSYGLYAYILNHFNKFSFQ